MNGEAREEHNKRYLSTNQVFPHSVPHQESEFGQCDYR